MFYILTLSTIALASNNIRTIQDLDPNDIRISEIMSSPLLNPDSQGEFLEFYNSTNDSIDLRGLIVENDSQDWIMVGGIYPASDTFSSPQDLTLSSTPIIIEPNSYLVISPNDNTSQNGNIVSSYNYPYGQLKLQNSDLLSLYQVDLTTLVKQSVALDSVNYTATEGVSTIRNYMDPYNDIWCSSTSSYFEGSFGNISGFELGSPLSENDECTTSHLDIDGDGLSEDQGDCDDRDHTIYPNAPEICDGIVNNCGAELPLNEIDNDNDGFVECTIDENGWDGILSEGQNPLLGDDCDDTNQTIFPNAPEICDGIVNNCGAELPLAEIDIDGDGFVYCTHDEGNWFGDISIIGGGDCNPQEISISPNGIEVCDNIDNNCDQIVDGPLSVDALTYYLDLDGDSFGDISNTTKDCSTPNRYVENDTDCDDTNEKVSPNADEYCDEIDNDCDGNIDESGSFGETNWFSDNDNDGFGSSKQSLLSCNQPMGYVSNFDDCNDDNAAIFIGADEVCDNIDNDCDGTIDGENAIDASSWYIDQDEDGYGFDYVNASLISSNEVNLDTDLYVVKSCEQPIGYVENYGDCDDNQPTALPNGIEVCDSVDNDCDGVVDDNALDVGIWYLDADGDGFGDANSVVSSCMAPSGYVLDATDCDDTDPDVTVFTNGCDTQENQEEQEEEEVYDTTVYTSSDINEAELTITEIMHSPYFGDAVTGQWFEIKNTSSSIYNLQGVTVSNISGESFTVEQEYILEQNQYVIFIASSDTTINGGLDEEVTNIAHNFATDRFSLLSDDTITLQTPTGTIVDEVSYSTDLSFPDKMGKSISLPSSFDSASNDLGSNWCSPSSTYGIGDFGTPGLENDECAPLATLSDISEGDIIISEIMHSPSKAFDYKGEWFELSNMTPLRINVNGMILKGENSELVEVTEDLFIDPYGYLVFATRDNAMENGGLPFVDYKYSSNVLRLNSKDTIRIETDDARLLDEVIYEADTFPFNRGNAISLGTFDSTLNDNGLYWCLGESTYGFGDFGTPGFTNAYCDSMTTLSSVSVGDLVVSEVFSSPTTVYDYKGEWFEIHNLKNERLNINGLKITSIDGGDFSITEDVVIDAEGYAVIGSRRSPLDNGGVENVVATYSIANFRINSTDSIQIRLSDDTLLDEVIFDDPKVFPILKGSSMELGSLDPNKNDSGLQWCLATDSFGFGDFGTPGEPNTSCEAMNVLSDIQVGDFVISEIMHTPSLVYDYKGEWFEIHNTTSERLNINGLKITSIDGGDFSITEDVVIDAEGYAVIGSRRSPLDNGGVENVVATYSIANFRINSTDSIQIRLSDDTLLDEVIFDDPKVFPILKGSSMELGSLDPNKNDSGFQWCLATDTFGLGDFGTPGAPNTSCSEMYVMEDLQIGDIIFSEVMHSPVQTADYKGEWFELYNTLDVRVNINGLVVKSDDGEFFDLTEDIILAPHGYAVIAARLSEFENGGIQNVSQRYNVAEFRLTPVEAISIETRTGIILDRINYDIREDYPQAKGASMSLGRLGSAENDAYPYWCESTSSYGVGDLGTPGEANDFCDVPVSLQGLEEGDLIVSEIMHTPQSVADHRGEWFEVYNSTSEDICIHGLEVEGSHGTGFTIEGYGIVPAGGYGVVATRIDPNSNGGIENVLEQYTINQMRLYKWGSIELYTPDGVQLDQLSYDSKNTHPDAVGSSISLGSLDSYDNDFGASWCSPTSTFGLGDFGTPGLENDICVVPLSMEEIQEGDLVISEVMHSPAAVKDYMGEWFEIHNTTSNGFVLTGLQITSDAGEQFTITEEVVIAPNGYAIFASRLAASENGGIENVDVRYYSSLFRLYGTDSIIIKKPDGTIVDRISFNTQDYYVDVGTSLSLGRLDAQQNDDYPYWCSSVSTYGDGDIGTPGEANDPCNVPVPVTDLQVGDLIISEIMHTPKVVADHRGEWFEVYNNTSNDVCVHDLIINGSHGTGLTVEGQGIIPANGYGVFGSRMSETYNGGITGILEEFTMEELKLYVWGNIEISSSNGTVFDSVDYNSRTTFPTAYGTSISASVLDPTENDSGIFWCTATSLFGDGDMGTPGEANDYCAPPMYLSETNVGDIIVTEVMHSPSLVSDVKGEWLEVHNTTSKDIILTGLRVENEVGEFFVVGGENSTNGTGEDLVIGAGAYALFASQLNPLANGGMDNVDMQYSFFRLRSTSSISISKEDNQVLDSVSFDLSYPNILGYSLQTNTLNSNDNDNSANWCTPTSDYGDGDFGTPGLVNNPCP